MPSSIIWWHHFRSIFFVPKLQDNATCVFAPSSSAAVAQCTSWRGVSLKRVVIFLCSLSKRQCTPGENPTDRVGRGSFPSHGAPRHRPLRCPSAGPQLGPAYPGRAAQRVRLCTGAKTSACSSRTGPLQRSWYFSEARRTPYEPVLRLFLR